MMKYFFWIAFAVFLAASIPHVAYFFASFEPTRGPEGVWWWGVSYAIAISIDVTVYLLSWTAFQRYRRYRSAKAVWQHWLLIVMCTFFSWAVNWAYAKQFHSATMLSSAEAAAPWLTSVFPFMASAFPLLGIVYTMMAETISETASEDGQQKNHRQLTALAEVARQGQLPMATLRKAITGAGRVDTTGLISPTATSEATASPEAEAPKEANAQAITGQILAIEKETSQRTPTSQVALSKDASPDKLQMTIEALRRNPDMTDEVLAEYLALKRPASARFWRLKAIEILNNSEKSAGEARTLDVWASATGALANGTTRKR